MGVLIFEGSQLIRQLSGGGEGLIVAQTLSSWPAFLGSTQWQLSVPPCGRSSGDFQGKWNSSSYFNACGPQRPNRSFPGLTKQLTRAPYPRHLEQPRLFFMLVYINVFLTVCVLIAQLSQLTGIGKENFWKTHH